MSENHTDLVTPQVASIKVLPPIANCFVGCEVQKPQCILSVTRLGCGSYLKISYYKQYFTWHISGMSGQRKALLPRDSVF